MVLPVAPTPLRARGAVHLGYELHITNPTKSDVELSKLEVLAGNVVVRKYEGPQLSSLLQGASPSNRRVVRANLQVIPAGELTIAFLWISLSANARIPPMLSHRLTTVSGQMIETVAVAVSKVEPAVLGPPLRGANWVAANGPGNTSGHRRSALFLNGRFSIPQRYAIDWVQIGPDAKASSGPGKSNSDFYGYGKEVLAVADGVIVSVSDGVPDNAPGTLAQPRTIGGNFITMDIGQGRYAYYAHLQNGSVRVKQGDKVQQGQVLALLGNSGNSPAGPHLHFQLGDSVDSLAAEGLPFVIDAFDMKVGGARWEPQRNQIPLNQSIVRFLGSDDVE